MSRNRHPSLSGRISWTVIRSDAQHWTALNILICAVKAQCGESRCCGSGNKKQVNVGHFQVYYTEVRPGVEQWRKVREGGGMEGEQLGEEGETEKAGVSIQKSPSCPTTNNTGQAFIYERTRFLPTFPVSFSFGLTRKVTRKAWHVGFWLSPANSSTQLPSDFQWGWAWWEGRGKTDQGPSPVQSLLSSSRL